ncbi:unnamed protein product (macronuclear) [Paramecium tetraurelia]|uniref:Uncharacterized protein n=1 Tax=Paramecium tetraurelia TaxID=5888 RepID=A0BRQ0_PARTE|nr:uncharacterized protein GSPATT00031448001 [Paramecium tetraurelia]CAK61217.1 unnamed protein product [Paramecium tetraurelia]|eukprot:XP_001428615.1 hypothetical protein (macronuclear) [Paramecium tetraurelia strain d4-2]
MGICCSGGQNRPKQKGEHKAQNIINVYQEQQKQDEFQELSGEIQEILEMYLKHEKNSPQHKSLSESSHLKHSLEMPNTPYFKNNTDSEDQFHFLRQTKQLEEISIEALATQKQ